ncbi:hypothetical protein [Aurantiacibacter marinus]|uniref:Uncharacterized protein n=1 Tax=Aurantiacibacter marinus TaxID=874156 RepID=A0A0H0XKG3_9SPHN|nr:hypothetical protein [Aurantiacibacter marinus]KLI62799.1 hypothetical protein AAV99_11930 [Aurantiacibacter marinus]
MIVLTGFLLCALVAMLMFPQTDFARLCHQQLIDRPVFWLSRFRTHHLVYVIVLVPLMLSGGEFLALLGPEFFAAYAMELAIYIDAVIFGLAMSVWETVRSATSKVTHLLRRPLRIKSARRKRAASTNRTKSVPANDDDRPGEVAIAA